ncbi:hypothetical protein VNO78_11096 [Psophocarpus tetragonolobus]|uniref:Uncharacterized protein n=1 Tax=Psophocarpus tetragonolobus TaxID=3891 RepID=A0AAN9SLQ7_PSOTE
MLEEESWARKEVARVSNNWRQKAKSRLPFITSVVMSSWRCSDKRQCKSWVKSNKVKSQEDGKQIRRRKSGRNNLLAYQISKIVRRGLRPRGMNLSFSIKTNHLN